MPPPDTAPAVQTGRKGAAWGGWRAGVRGTHPSMASSTSCLIPLPSNTASCEAPASNTALKPKVASCLAALTWGQRRLRGCRSPPRTPTPRRGAGTYVDGAVTEAVHNLLVASPRLCAGQWPDPNVGCGRGHKRVAAWGPWGALL